MGMAGVLIVGTIIPNHCMFAMRWYRSHLFGIINPPMALKNFRSEIAVEKIFAELQKTLGTHGAKQISFDYGDDGRVQGVQFVIKVQNRFIPIRLPARVEK